MRSCGVGGNLCGFTWICLLRTQRDCIQWESGAMQTSLVITSNRIWLVNNLEMGVRFLDEYRAFEMETVEVIP
jgi:hypothetical protein